MSIQLTDGSKYEGGDLRFQTATDEPAPRGVGSLVVFPSYLVHRVDPVTKGARLSLVSWIAGPPFR
jgi:PKHD-type hydroxylase